MRRGPYDIEMYLYRHTKKSTYTIGRLYVNGAKFCDTLEDKDRGLNQTLPLATNTKLKVYGQTAIPMGTYELSTQIWSKYGYRVCVIKNVPAFTGILIHNGYSTDNTEGCPLVGDNTITGHVTNGKHYMLELSEMVYNARLKGGRCTITVADTPPSDIVKPRVAGVELKSVK